MEDRPPLSGVVPPEFSNAERLAQKRRASELEASEDSAAPDWAIYWYYDGLVCDACPGRKRDEIIAFQDPELALRHFLWHDRHGHPVPKWVYGDIHLWLVAQQGRGVPPFMPHRAEQGLSYR